MQKRENTVISTPGNLLPPPLEKGNKVFVIGWHRTGTRSLAHALRILGFKTVHWWPGWLSQREVEKPSILRKFDAFADFPFPLIYRQLDKWYPDARFILTTRTVESWLRSVKVHFDDGHWNRDGIGIRLKRMVVRMVSPTYLSHYNRRVEVEEMFKIAYGRITFDRDVFMRRFLDHNDDVLSYFSTRQKNFLHLDLHTNFGWDALCPFLGMPRPAQSFPHEYSLRG
jgi:hypothetical protein